MNLIKGLLVLAIFTACSASHTLKFEHSIAHALKFAERVIDEDIQDSVAPAQPRA